MYIPTAFHETRTEVLHAFIRKHTFATLISHGANGLSISHLPLLLNDTGTKLFGHLARRNPHWHDFAAGRMSPPSSTARTRTSRPAGTPRGAAVPTWNYANV